MLIPEQNKYNHVLPKEMGQGQSSMKRIVDIVLSLLALTALAPVFLLLYFKIRQELGSPVLFTQARVGKNSEIFQLYKFRTMTDDKDANGSLLADEHRLPAFGRRLRASSLDELPTLYNVLCGEMSIVGPRPLLVEYLPLYSSEQARRHEVTPGITGWAQVNGRNSVSWSEKFKFDTWYVDNKTLWLDFRIILMTFSKVLRKEGIAAEGMATMSKFTGSEK